MSLIPLRRSIGPIRPLTREDMARLFDGAFRPAPITDLRSTHHRVARLAATGLRQIEIAERTGFSAQRISTLLSSPAMQELIARYSAEVDAAFIRSQDEFYTSATSNMKMAEALLTDRLERDLDAVLEGREPTISIKDLVAVSADRADRFGYPKHTQNTNVNVNWAEALERANDRSRLALKPRSEEVDA